MGRFMAAIRAAANAFREAYTHADTPDGDTTGAFDAWNLYDARRLRYAMAWAYYQNDAYRIIHAWSRSHKTTYGLYKHTRNIYNPVHRLIEFWVIHTHGGLLDPEMGDGQATPSCLPIDTKNEAIRPALAKLMLDSRWQRKKANVPRYGALFGDVPIRVCDDTVKGMVRLEVLHPKHIPWADQDPQGNVKAYVYEDLRYDPRRKVDMAALTAAATGAVDPELIKGMVRYREEVERDGEHVTFRTFLDGSPFDWRPDASGNPAGLAVKGGGEAEWAEPYGFVPLVLAQHDDVGLDWGMSAHHSLQSKVRECDDLASKTHDQIRKTVDARYWASGVADPADIVVSAGATPTYENRDPDRQEVPIYCLPDPAARIAAMVAPLDLGHALQAVTNLVEEMERDCPELAMDIWAAGDPSGRAIKEARKRVEAKVAERRAGYDDALARAMKMAISIGGMRNYDGYAGFDLGSYDAGNMDFRIAPRPVFASDDLDRLEVETSRWALIRTQVSCGLPLPLAVEHEGWTDKMVEELKAAQVEDAARANPDGTLTTQTTIKAQDAAAPGAEQMTPAEIDAATAAKGGTPATQPGGKAGDKAGGKP